MESANIWFTWGEVFNSSLRDLWFSFVQFTPKFIIAVVFFIVGWLLGNIIARAFEQVFGSLKVDNLLRSIGVDEFFRKAGMSLDSGYFVGQLVKWFVVLVFLLPSLSLVGLSSISDFLKDDIVSGLLPNVIIAVLVLIIAAFVSEAISKTVVASARTMSISAANMLGAVAKYAVWVFAFIFALGKLGLEAYMGTLFTGIIAMISLGGALAFGLGGKEAATRFIAKVSEEVSRKE